MESKTVKLLLLEDEPAHAEAIRRALKSSATHFQVRLVGTLREYHESVAAGPPDIALLDMVLPDGGALELLPLSPLSSPFPLIVMTSHGDEQTAVATMKAGALDYIVKSPDSFADMPRIVTHALDHWQLLQERKQSQEALKESEERFRNMTNLLPQAIFETDEKSNFIFVNRQGFEMFGYNEADIASGMSVLETIIPQDRDRAVENINLRIRGMQSPPQEYTAVRKDGSKFPAMIYAAPIIINSRYAGMRGMMIDITDRKKMEDALKESEAQYRLLAEHMTDTVWLMDMQLKTTYQSPSAEKLRGYKPEEILEMPPDKHVTPDSLKLVFEVLSEEIPRVEADPGYSPVRTVDLEYYHKDGTTLWAESKFSVIRDESGKPVSILAEARDITDRKKAEEALRESEEKYRTVVENAQESMVVLVNGMFKFANGRIEELTGYPREELSSIPFTEFIHPIDRQMVADRYRQRLMGEAVPRSLSE